MRTQRGSLRKRKSGGLWTWLGAWWENGHRRAKTLGRCAEVTKAEAQGALDALVHPVNVAQGTTEHTLQTLARQVVFPWYERAWKRSTAMTTKDRIDHHILKALGNKPLSWFTRDRLQDFLDQKAKTGTKKETPLSQDTLAHLRWDLRQVFRMALNDGLLPRNPAELLHIPKGVRYERRILTIDELRTLLFRLPVRDRLILSLAGISGLRPGEIFGLQWGDAQPEGLRITRAIYRGKTQTPKSHHSVRTAAISASITNDLALWRTITTHPSPEDWVFPSENGTKPIQTGNYWRRAIKPTTDTLEMTGVTFQALRRTCATTLNSLGIDGKLVADQLGHTLDVSQNVYTKSGIARQAAAIKQLDDALAPLPIAS